MRIFSFLDYRRFLNDFIDKSKESRARWNFAKLAEAADLNRSYLSQVLSGASNLSSDQAYLIGRAIGLTGDELEYFGLLVELERSQVSGRKTQLRRRRDEFRTRYLKTKEFLGETFVDVQDRTKSQYYQDAYCTLVHMFLTIPEYLGEPLRIGPVIGLSEARLKETLDTLQSCGILERTGGGYALKEAHLHLDRDSPLMRVHGTMFRAKAMEYQQKSADSEDYFLSIGFSADPVTRARIKTEFQAFFKEASKSITAAPCEEVYVLNFDLFKV